MSSLLNRICLISKTTRKSITATTNIQMRCKGYISSPFVCDLDEVKVKYEKTNDPADWKYVERLLPPLTVPKPTEKPEYPSDWRPQGNDAKNLPYFIPRNKNHMMPVYLQINFDGLRRLTYVKKIEGDIWLLEEELTTFLQKESKKPIRSQVNEMVRYICYHGDHVNAIKYYLTKKNM